MDARAARVSPPIRKFGYLLLPLLATLPLHAWWLARWLGHWEARVWDAWAFLVPVVFFIAVPILDALVGQDPTNPRPEDEAALDGDRFYRWLPLACLRLYLGMLVFGAWVMARRRSRGSATPAGCCRSVASAGWPRSTPRTN